MILLLPSVFALLTLGKSTSAATVVKISKPKLLATSNLQSQSQPPHPDSPSDFKFYSPDLKMPTPQEMQRELDSYPTMTLVTDYTNEKHNNFSDYELSLMRLQPPKPGAVKNYYALNSKSKLKKFQEPKKKQFSSKVKQLTTVEPRVIDGFYQRSDNTMVFADETNKVYISARPVDGPRTPRARNGKIRPEDLNTGEYLPDTDFFVIDAKDFGHAPTDKTTTATGKQSGTKTGAKGTQQRNQRADESEFIVRVGDVNGEMIDAVDEHGNLLLRRYDDDDDDDDEEEEEEEEEEEDDAFGNLMHKKNVGDGKRDYNQINNNNNNNIGDDERMEFQMHGFNGPDSYKFGYDTGKGPNRQFRVEQRDKNGNVKGEYGYFDRNGKMIVIRYISTAEDGFKSEKVFP